MLVNRAPETPLSRAVLDAFRKVAAEQSFSGVLHLAGPEGVLIDEAFGIASRRWGVPIHPGMRFDVASVTKLFTAVAVLQQVDAGTVDLDGPIGDSVDLAGTTISPDITLRQLLTHTSGIADDADEEAGESYEALWVNKANYSVTRTADFLPQFAHKAPRAEPGSECRYCNVGYILAGLVLEAATGLAYRDYVVEQVFGRAGMTASGFFDMREAVPDVVEGWERAPDRPGGWRQNIYSYPPIGSPDGGAHTTAPDLVRFLEALRAGELLSPELTAAMLTPQVLHHVTGDVAVHYGFGLEFEVVDGGVRAFSKDGVNTGVSAHLRCYPASGMTLVVLSNSEDGAWGPTRAVNKVLLGGGG